MLKDIKEKLHSGMGKDIILTFTIQILIMLCSFAINKLLANRLSIDEFGQYNVIKRSVQVLSFVMLAGVGIALPRYIPIYRNSNPPRKTAPLLTAALIYIIGITTVVLAICLLFSSQMRPVIIGESNNSNLMLIAMAYAFILAMAQYVFAYYRGSGKYLWYNGSQLFMQLAIIIPLVLLPLLTISNVFGSWLVITILLVVYLMGRELWRYIHQGGSINLNTNLVPHLTTIIKYSSGRLIADFFQFSLAAFPLISTNHSLLFCWHYLCNHHYTPILIPGYYTAALYLTSHRPPRNGCGQPPYHAFINIIHAGSPCFHRSTLAVHRIPHNATFFKQLHADHPSHTYHDSCYTTKSSLYAIPQYHRCHQHSTL